MCTYAYNTCVFGLCMTPYFTTLESSILFFTLFAHVLGESYGGHYVPELALLVHQNLEKGVINWPVSTHNFLAANCCFAAYI